MAKSLIRITAVGEEASSKGRPGAAVAAALRVSRRWSPWSSPGPVHDSVHVGRQDQPAQRPVDRIREAEVAVVEGGPGGQRQLERQDSHGRRAEGDDAALLEHQGEQDPDGMEACAGGRIDGEIGVIMRCRRHRSGTAWSSTCCR
jgi:hypothetical protein